MFYPENDIALGSGLRRFTAPKNAARLRHDCGFLLASVADDGDCVIFNSRDSAFESGLLSALGKSIVTNISDAEEFRPWGWSLASKQMLVDYGVSPGDLPGDDMLGRIRALSHRRTAIEINKRLSRRGIDVPPLSLEIMSVDELDLSRRWMIKTPWSSSGRGVVDSQSVTHSTLSSRIDGIVRRQGCVLAEAFLTEIRNFAMLYEVADGQARYIGLSLFDNLSGGAYSGNLVASQHMLKQELSSFVAEAYIEKISTELETVLTELIGECYSGYCGVDMMVYDDNGTMKVAPCIELNLRMTMGTVAFLLAEKVVASGQKAMMCMDRNKCSRAPVFDSHRLVDGDLMLTPPSEQFGFSLKIL